MLSWEFSWSSQNNYFLKHPLTVAFGDKLIKSGLEGYNSAQDDVVMPIITPTYYGTNIKICLINKQLLTLFKTKIISTQFLSK